MTRSWLRTVARGLVGVLLFAQMAIAAYACPALSSAGAAEMQMPASFAVPMPDCNAVAGAMDPSAANLCAEHCKSGQQSDQASALGDKVSEKYAAATGGAAKSQQDMAEEALSLKQSGDPMIAEQSKVGAVSY